jgi:hypothetical protein
MLSLVRSIGVELDKSRRPFFPCSSISIPCGLPLLRIRRSCKPSYIFILQTTSKLVYSSRLQIRSRSIVSSNFSAPLLPSPDTFLLTPIDRRLHPTQPDNRLNFLICNSYRNQVSHDTKTKHHTHPRTLDDSTQLGRVDCPLRKGRIRRYRPRLARRRRPLSCRHLRRPRWRVKNICTISMEILLIYILKDWKEDLSSHGKRHASMKTL